MLDSSTMEEAAQQARERLIRWIDEGRDIVSLLNVLVESGQRLTDKLHHAEREGDLLRKELHELRKEVSDLRDAQGERQRAQGDIEIALAELKKQNEALRQERDEVAQAFARLLESVQSTNVIAQKLGVTKSPFARAQPQPAAPAPAAPPQHD
jgi:chromosome segregation ATPase